MLDNIVLLLQDERVDLSIVDKLGRDLETHLLFEQPYIYVSVGGPGGQKCLNKLER